MMIMIGAKAADVIIIMMTAIFICAAAMGKGPVNALDTALRSSLDPQDVLHWALEARSIGIDDDADVTVFVRLLTQQ